MISRRLWAAGALAATFAAVALAIAVAAVHFPEGLTELACLIVAVGAAWWGVRRRGVRRAIGLAVTAAALVGAIVLVLIGNRLLEDVLVVVAFSVALAATRMVFRVHVTLPQAAAPAHAVLFYNPLSGGGKATRFRLVEEAHRRRISAVELTRGEDLEELVRTTVAHGADGLAMAGGDGSQAIVAMVAAELGLPYACIPAGTRNHFALDLGVNRDDVVGALDAFVDGGERLVDLAEINGRVFVNNVSLGLYAEAVQRPGYRDAKMHTLLDTVPDVLGPDAAASALRWQGLQGAESGAAILISNNAYRLGHMVGAGTRPTLDSGLLGVTALAPIAGEGARSGPRPLTIRQWTAESFQVDSDGPVAAGIDGEAVMLDPPLRLRIRPRALRVRIAPNHPGASPSALEPETLGQTLGALARLAVRGAPPRRAATGG